MRVKIIQQKEVKQKKQKENKKEIKHMALGRQNNGSGQTTNTVFLRDVSSKSEKAEEFRGKTGVPYFQVSRKIDGKWTPDGKEDTFSGTLLSVSTEKRYKEDDEKQKEFIDKYGNPWVLKVEVADPEVGETYVWKTGFTIASRTVANSLLGVNLGDELQISTGKKKSGYDSFFIRKIVGGRPEDKTVPWTYELDDVPKAKETTFKGKVMRDYTEVDDFYVDKIKAKFGDQRAPMPEVKESPPKAVNSKKSVDVTPDVTEEESGSEDAIPF